MGSHDRFSGTQLALGHVIGIYIYIIYVIIILTSYVMKLLSFLGDTICKSCGNEIIGTGKVYIAKETHITLEIIILSHMVHMPSKVSIPCATNILVVQ